MILFFQLRFFSIEKKIKKIFYLQQNPQKVLIVKKNCYMLIVIIYYHKPRIALLLVCSVIDLTICQLQLIIISTISQNSTLLRISQSDLSIFLNVLKSSETRFTIPTSTYKMDIPVLAQPRKNMLLEIPG